MQPHGSDAPRGLPRPDAAGCRPAKRLQMKQMSQMRPLPTKNLDLSDLIHLKSVKLSHFNHLNAFSVAPVRGYPPWEWLSASFHVCLS